MNVLSKDNAENGRRGKDIKALMVVCIILIASIGVTIGMILEKQANAQTASTSQPDQPKWHQVAIYTGPDAVNGTFLIVSASVSSGIDVCCSSSRAR